MPIPPRGDPTRPLVLAGRAGRVLGGLLVAAGALVAVTLLRYGLDPRESATAAAFVGAAAGVYAVPGLLAWFLAAYLNRRRRAWAAVSLSALAGLIALVAGASLVRAVLAIARQAGWAAVSTPDAVIALLLVAGAFVAAVASAVFAGRSVAATRVLSGAATGPRGFRPLVTGPADLTATRLPLER